MDARLSSQSESAVVQASGSAFCHLNTVYSHSSTLNRIEYAHDLQPSVLRLYTTSAERGPVGSRLV